VAHAALPDFRPVDSREALVDRDDARDVELGKGADPDVRSDGSHALRIPSGRDPRERFRYQPERRRRVAARTPSTPRRPRTSSLWRVLPAGEESALPTVSTREVSLAAPLAFGAAEGAGRGRPAPWGQP